MCGQGAWSRAGGGRGGSCASGGDPGPAGKQRLRGHRSLPRPPGNRGGPPAGRGPPRSLLTCLPVASPRTSPCPPTRLPTRAPTCLPAASPSAPPHASPQPLHALPHAPPCAPAGGWSCASPGRPGKGSEYKCFP